MAENEGTPPKPVDPPKPFNSLVDWFAINPRIGLIGTIASIVGLPLALISIFLTQKEREIRYATSESPTTIVKGGLSSNLRVYYQGKELTSDVTSIQIAIWNAGREAVKRDNILSKTVTLKLDPPGRILEARVKKVSRNIVNFQLDTSLSETGILNCSWDVFEPSDGSLLEVFYAGSGAQILSEGAIEGQVPIRRYIFGGGGTIFLSGWQKFMSALMGMSTGLIWARVRWRATKSIVDAVLTFLMSGIMASLATIILMGIYGTLTSHTVPFAF